MIIGILIGIIIGICIMCCLQINRENKYYETIQAIRNLSNYIAIRVQQSERLEPEYLKGMKEVQKIYENYFEEELK